MSLVVLLVEDDKELRTTLRDACTVEGYDVLAAASLADARALLTHAKQKIDLILLDLGLPDGEGGSFLDEVRHTANIPVLIISARSDDGKKIELLDLGADDYLIKPFGVPELFARMRVALRHRGTYTSAPLTHFESGNLQIDLSAHQVTLNGEQVHLTPTEFKLLARLVRNAGQVVTHRQLLNDVWGAEYAEHTHYLRLYMAQLRAKIEDKPAEPQRLLTEPGVGYRLVTPEA